MLASDGAKYRIFQLAVCVRKNLNIFHPKFVGRGKFTPDHPSTRRTCPPLADKRPSGPACQQAGWTISKFLNQIFRVK
jgi:hypothetical protein